MSSKNIHHILDAWLDKPGPFRYRAFTHVLFWLGFFIYEVLIWGLIDNDYRNRMGISLIELPIKILATYLTLYVLIDRLLIVRKYGLFVISMLLSMILVGVSFRFVSYYIVYPIYYPDGLKLPLFYPPKILIYTFQIYSLVAIVASFHLSKHWYKHQQAAMQLEQATKEMEKEKLAAELKLLKSQINPHFLFNTLNNLYSLTLNHSEKSPEVVYKLSQLMSYMLYDSNQSEVSLEREVEYIQNYISLERIRYTNLDISMNVFDDVNNIRVAPLLILPFVENSFKHGASNQLSNGFIRIDIGVQAQTLVIKVENSKVIPEVPRRPSGIGLQNLKKRLELIYPNRHTLQIFDEEDVYLVTLRIEGIKSIETGRSVKQIKSVENEMSYR